MHKKFKNNILRRKHYDNALIIGSGLGYLESLLACCNSVFIIPDEGFSVRRKNLIVKENFDKIESLPGISFIFMDWHQAVNIKKMSNLILSQKPDLLIESKELILVEQIKWLHSHKYALTEKEKKYHRWEYKCNIQL